MKATVTKILLMSLLVSVSNFVFSQNNSSKTLYKDSLKRDLQKQNEDTNKVNNLLKLSRRMSYDHDFTNALDYLNQALALSEKLGFKKGKGDAYLIMGNTYLDQGNNPEGIKNLYSALKTWEEIGDKKNIASCHGLLGKAYFSQGNYSEALKNNSIALDFSKAINNKAEIAECYQSLGVVYTFLPDYSEALKNYSAALKIREERGDSTGIAQTCFALGMIYQRQGDYSKALENYSAALKIFGEPRQPNWGLTMVYEGIGFFYEEKGDLANKNGYKSAAVNNFAEARRNYLLAFEKFEKNFAEIPVHSYTSLGRIAIKLNNFSEAKDYLEKGLQLSRSFEDKKSCLLLFSTLDSAQGNYKQAYIHYKMYSVYVDSLLKEENVRSSLQVRMQYEFDKKEAAAKLQQLEYENVQERRRTGQWRAIVSLAALILVFLLIMFFQWRNSKHRKKANLLLQQQKEKVETTLSELRSTQSQLIQSEKMASLGELTAGIAHEIQNPLNFVNNFSDVNKEMLAEMNQEIEKGNYDEVKAIAKDITDNEEKINHHGKRADAIVKGMLQHSRNSTGQKEPTDINALADEYLRLAYHGLRAKDKSFNTIMKTDYDESIGNINIIPQDIGRVILNLINNAFYAVDEKKKYASASLAPNGYEPTVSVITKKDNGKVEIKVKDNGNGIPQKVLDKIFQPFFTTKPTGQGTGLGLSLSYDIVKAHGGEIKAETVETEGSIFKIILPA